MYDQNHLGVSFTVVSGIFLTYQGLLLVTVLFRFWPAYIESNVHVFFFLVRS